MLIQTYEGKSVTEWALLAKERQQTIEAQVRRIRELDGHVEFLGATETNDGGIILNMRKYHAAHRCEAHRQEPWRDLDCDSDCFVCIKQKVKELEAELDRTNYENAHANQQTRQTLFQGIKDRDVKIQQLETELAQMKGRIAIDEDSHL